MSYYDPKLAERYDAHFRRRVDRAEDAAIDSFMGNLNGRSVLDLGCGTCALLDRHRPGVYLGVDIAEPMLRQAVTKYPRLARGRGWRLACGDASQHPEQEDDQWLTLDQAPMSTAPFQGYFDVAVSLFAFSYFPHPVTALRNVYDMLRPGGVAYVQGFTSRYQHREHCIDMETHRSYTATSLSMTAAEAGLIPTRVVPMGWLPDGLANLLPVPLGTRLQVGHAWTPKPYTLMLEAHKPAP